MDAICVDILDYLKNHPGVKAWQIAKSIGVQENVVNARLYGDLRGKIQKDEHYCWWYLYYKDTNTAARSFEVGDEDFTSDGTDSFSSGEERLYDNLIPVRHVRGDFKGWIADVSKMGVREAHLWRYRVWDAHDKIHLAFQSELELDPKPASRIPQKLFDLYVPHSQESSDLFLLGYRLSDLSIAERRSILLNSAIPALGVERTVSILCDLIWRKIKQKNCDKYWWALSEWHSDINFLLDKYDQEKISSFTLNYFTKIQEILG